MLKNEIANVGVFTSLMFTSDMLYNHLGVKLIWLGETAVKETLARKQHGGFWLTTYTWNVEKSKEHLKSLDVVIYNICIQNHVQNTQNR